MQNEIRIGAFLNVQVEREQVRKNRRVCCASVLKVECPLHGWKIPILDSDATNLQTSDRVDPSQRFLLTLRINPMRRAFKFPCFQEFNRRVAAEDKRERRVGGTLKFGCVPTVRFGLFIG